MKKLHRWVGIIVAVYVVLVCISGFVHVIAHNLYHGPHDAKPGIMTGFSSAVISPSQLPLGVGVNAVNLRQIDGKLWYQVISGSSASYFDAITGIKAEQDKAYAKQIAKDFLHKNPVSVEYIDKYNNEYTPYKNPLPVYRVSAGDEWVYVSTINGNVALHLNQPKAVTSQIFRSLHMFTFIPWQLPRDIFMSVMVLGLLVTTIFGVVMFFQRRKKKAKK